MYKRSPDEKKNNLEIFKNIYQLIFYFYQDCLIFLRIKEGKSRVDIELKDNKKHFYRKNLKFS